MQKQDRYPIIDRAVYLPSNMIAGQAELTKDAKLMPVLFLGLINFTLNEF